jgi:tetratricopeptide (TPR) repeat protein
MRLTELVLGACVATVLAIPSPSRGETPQESSAKGKALLAQGDYDGALAAYIAATKAVPGNQEYRDQYSTVRRIVQLRAQLRAEKEPQRWEYTARALHNLYVGQGLLTEAASLARELHARLKAESSAILLAETELTMNRNAAAAEVLASLEKPKSTAASKILLAIALARQSKMDLAREVIKTADAVDSTDPGMAYLMARLYALTGDSAGATASLARCLESLPPSRQDGVKSHARQCPDFAGVVAAPEFEQALSVESRVAESQCSGGSGCANCPMRKGCPKSQAEQSR